MRGWGEETRSKWWWHALQGSLGYGRLLSQLVLLPFMPFKTDPHKTLPLSNGKKFPNTRIDLERVYRDFPLSQPSSQAVPFPTFHQPHLFDQDVEEIQETPRYLFDQVITYIGNKRSLIPFIDHAVQTVKKQLGKDKIDIFEPFTGSGVVARYFKQHASHLIVNDLEDYTIPLGKCYLANRTDIDLKELCEWNRELSFLLGSQDQLNSGFITELYAPRDELSIQPNERVFYTLENALRIDTARQFIATIPSNIQSFFLAPLLAKASIHANTSGVFKGFYKDKETGIGCYGGRNRDALSRICAPIKIPLPVLSNFSTNVEICQSDAAVVAQQIPSVDLAYLDPPYNQHPYGSNYFMLNLITNYQRPTEISRVSGIPVNWNRSKYNQRSQAGAAFWRLINHIKAKYMIISYNAEGFITYENMINMLMKLGDLSIFEKQYNTFRACRNLANRPKHVTEYLFLVEVK